MMREHFTGLNRCRDDKIFDKTFKRYLGNKTSSSHKKYRDTIVKKNCITKILKYHCPVKEIAQFLFVGVKTIRDVLCLYRWIMPKNQFHMFNFTV